jgi:hypothetical protein
VLLAGVRSASLAPSSGTVFAENAFRIELIGFCLSLGFTFQSERDYVASTQAGRKPMLPNKQ